MSNVDLSVVGLGLVSPTAMTPRQHAFFIRAESALGSARAFVDAAGEPLGVIHCPWLDPSMPMSQRLAALGTGALQTALGGMGEVAAMSCVATPWQALQQEDVAHAEQAMATKCGVSFHARLQGAAGIFAGLATAQQWLASGHPAVALVAVDSFCDLEAVRQRAVNARRWERVPAYLSEAAAALVVTLPGGEGGRPSLGRISFAGALQGSSSDDDDEIVDGRAMTQLLGAASQHHQGLGGLRMTQAFGQHNVDQLRRNCWGYALVRNKEVVDPLCRFDCIEDSIGRVGAAAGAVHLVYGLATELHGTAAFGGGGQLVAWAVSRSGLRGMAIAQGAVQ